MSTNRLKLANSTLAHDKALALLLASCNTDDHDPSEDQVPDVSEDQLMEISALLDEVSAGVDLTSKFIPEQLYPSLKARLQGLEASGLLDRLRAKTIKAVG